MSKILVHGCAELNGTIVVNGSKNSALPIIAASMLCESPVTLTNIPNIRDISVMCDLASSTGSNVSFIPSHTDHSHSIKILPCISNGTDLNRDLAKKIRASMLMISPMLTRCGNIAIGYPGGCKIGERPIDMHISALSKMGASFDMLEDQVIGKLNGRFKCNNIAFEKVSVGATETTILAAVTAEGISVLQNVATEPEVCDLILFLTKCGAKIAGAGTRTLVIEGVPLLHGCKHHIIPDRIEAGTYILAAIMTNGIIKIEGINLSQVSCISNAITSIGGTLTPSDNGITARRHTDKIKSANISTNPYPNFPSDMQAQFMSAMCIADSTSVIEENVFENRFMHVHELRKMGANISVQNNKAIVYGKNELLGSNISATDLRASAALLLAAMSAKTESIIENISFLHRGYENIEEKFRRCGAEIHHII